MYSDVRLLVMRPDLSVLAIEENHIRFEASRSENNVGSFACSLPMRAEYEALTADYCISVQQSFDGGAHWVNTDGTIWFVRDITIETVDGSDRLTLAGHDTIGLLERRIVAWFSVKNQDIEQNYYSIKYGPATNLIRQIVRENFTVIATTAKADDYPSSVTQIGANQRVMTALGVEGDTGEGGNVKAEFAWQSVLQALGGIVSTAKGEHDERILFDVRYTGAIVPFLFVCRMGMLGRDLSKSVLISDEAGTLGTPRMTLQYSKEVTWYHIGGKGEAALRTTLALTDQANFARTPYYPIECFVDAGDTNDQAVMRQKGNIAMAKSTPRWVLAGTLIETPGLRYGRDFNFGDIVMARYRGRPFPCRVRSYRMRCENGAVQFEIPLETDVDE